MFNNKDLMNQKQSLKLIIKNGALFNGRLARSISILPLLEKQDDTQIKHALIIEELFTKNIWFIYGYKNGICSCYANLNNNDFAEFGSVRFSDIVESFGLESGWDDNKFVISHKTFKPYCTTEEIIDICKRT